MLGKFFTDFKKGGGSQFDWIFFFCIYVTWFLRQLWTDFDDFFCIGFSIVSYWYHINFIGIEPFLLCMFTSKIQCRMVIPQVLDENQSLFLFLTRFLYIFSKDNGNENNAVAMVTYKISSQIFSISQREAYPFLFKLG